MEEIIKLIESTEIYKNSISNDLEKEYQDYHYDIDLKIITELHKKALQFQQTDVSGCNTIRNCKQCGKKVSCDKDFCNVGCRYIYYR